MAMTALEVHERWVALLREHYDCHCTLAGKSENLRGKEICLQRALCLQEVMAEALDIGNDLIRDALGHLPAATAPLAAEQHKETDNG